MLDATRSTEKVRACTGLHVAAITTKPPRRQCLRPGSRCCPRRSPGAGWGFGFRVQGI